MSATIFNNMPHVQRNSKIPVPASPVPLRRTTSLRFPRDMVDDATSSPSPSYGRRADAQRAQKTRRFASPTDARGGVGVGVATPPPASPLRRGKSFMERGERGNGNSRGRAAAAGHGENGSSDVGAVRRTGVLCTETRRTGDPRQAADHRTRSLSLSLSSNPHLLVPQTPSVASSPKTPPTSPSEGRYQVRGTDWDNESVTSGISGISVASSVCDHASVARNGTTFSGRSMKYVFHCNQHAGATGEDYLTPTQRAHKQVRKLKNLLQQAQKDLDQRDSDILKLTKEVVELRLYKAALSSPEERSNSSDAVTVKENEEEIERDEVRDVLEPSSSSRTDMFLELETRTALNHVSMIGSFTDSGHFDDCTNSSVHSKDSDFQSPYKRCKDSLVDKSVGTETSTREETHTQQMADYERRINDLVKSHENESQEQRQKHNDKVEELLQRIAEINKRYWELVPDLDNAKERIKELETQLEEALKKLEEQEEKNKQMYLQMYAQGQEAAKVEREKQVMELAQTVPSRISVPELLQQLQVTQSELENIKDIEYASTSNSLKPLLSAKEAVTLWVLGARKAMYKQLLEAKNKKLDPEITLQFLKSAIFYFLTDKENNQGHLRAIQSILGFTPDEISNIEKARST